MVEENLIPILELENDFDYFLQRPKNKRIFFSGKFGIGKTYFLKDFFKIKKENFEVFHLFPSNYQINRNEDVMELIKYDILVELFKKNSAIFEGKDVKGIKDSALLFYSWCKKNFSFNYFLQSSLSVCDQISRFVQNPIGLLGRPLEDLLEIDKQFQEFKREYKLGEKGLVEKFIEENKSKSFVENDYLSCLINEKIKKLKGSKKSVLVLDDIDRIDPDHVFRILNILSAHFDDENNKFGFDHVIIVGDINNIKSLFYHKYGTGTDFQGYFNKFSSIIPYYFNNKGIIATKIPLLIEKIKCEENDLKNALGRSGHIKTLLNEVLNRALIIDKLNLRELYNPLLHDFVELKSGVYKNNSLLDNSKRILDIGIKLLIAIFGGDKNDFILILEKIKENISEDDDDLYTPYNIYIGYLIKHIIKIKNGARMGWRGYTFVVPENSQDRDFKIEGNKSTHEKFFYDILAEYIKNEKYKK